MPRPINFEIEDEARGNTRDERAAWLSKAADAGSGIVRAGVREICAVDSDDEENRELEFVTSDETVDSYGDIIEAKGWDLSHYKNNPLFLWMHNNAGLPIGRSVKHWTDKAAGQLRQVFSFFGPGVGEMEGDHAKFADTIFRLYKGWKEKGSRKTIRGLNATSVGFLPKPKSIVVPDREEADELGMGPWGVRFTAQWLKETSGVTVPANPNALVTNSYATLMRHAVLTDDDIEVMRAFNIQPEWLHDLRAECGMARTISVPAVDNAPVPLPPDEIVDRVMDRLESDDALGPRQGDENGADEPDRSREPGTGKFTTKAMKPRELRRHIEHAIITLTTISESLGEEDGDEADGEENTSLAVVPNVRLEAIERELREIRGALNERKGVDPKDGFNPYDYILNGE